MNKPALVVAQNLLSYSINLSVLFSHFFTTKLCIIIKLKGTLTSQTSLESPEHSTSLEDAILFFFFFSTTAETVAARISTGSP